MHNILKTALLSGLLGIIGGLCIGFSIQLSDSPANSIYAATKKDSFSIEKVESKDHYNVFVIDDEETGNSYIGFSYLSANYGKVSVSITPRLDGQEYYQNK